MNTIYGRWWHPADEKAGKNPVENSPLKWTSEYEDGLGNPIRMLAYANPEDHKNELTRADGYGIVRFDKSNRTITFESWPRFADVLDGDSVQFPGWPITIRMEDNDDREPIGYLPEIAFDGADCPVFQVIDESTGEIVYTVRHTAPKFRALFTDKTFIPSRLARITPTKRRTKA